MPDLYAAEAMFCSDCGASVPMRYMVAAVIVKDELWDECGACGGQLLTAPEFEEDPGTFEYLEFDEDEGEWW